MTLANKPTKSQIYRSVGCSFEQHSIQCNLKRSEKLMNNNLTRLMVVASINYKNQFNTTVADCFQRPNWIIKDMYRLT